MPYRFIVCFFIAVACSLGAARITSAQEKSTVKKEDQIRIAATKKADEAIELGKQFLESKQLAAATVSVERACTLQPDLLTDSQAQTPENWNRFWFTERASIQEKRLPKTDAAGRVNIAKWLMEAKLSEPAADMLALALAVDKNLPEAQELAKKWNVTARDAIQIDLSVRLKEPLLLDSFKDENLDVMLRKGRVFLLVPVKYNPGNSKLPINKTFLKVTSDDGKACTMKGIVLLKSSTGASPGSGPIELAIQEPGEPLWERLQVDRKTNENEFELTCFNVTPAMRGPKERAAGQRSPQEGGVGGKQARTGSGYLAFLAEVPAEMSAVDLEYRGSAAPLHLTADFLKALSEPVEGLKRDQLEKAASVLIEESDSQEAAIAAAAVKKLAQLKKAAGAAPAPTESAKQKVAGEDKIERALIEATAHPDPVTQRAGFEALVLEPESLSATTSDMVRNLPETAVLMALLEQVAAVLIASQSETEEATGSPPTPGADVSEAVSMAVADLKPSKVSPNVFAVLAACLKHTDAKVRSRAMELLLNDGTRESVIVLAKSTNPARETLVGKLGSVAKPEVKAAVLRCLLIRADGATAAKIMANSGELTVTIAREDDPLIAALASQSSPEAVKRLLDLIGQSDLSGIANSEAFKKTLTNLATAQQKDAGVRSALLKLAGKHLPTNYEAPVKRERTTGAVPASGSAFEAVLAILAAGADAETSHAAAEALIRVGRLGALNERFKSVPNARRQDVISHLFNNKKLWEAEALPVFLVSRLSDTEAKAAQPALAALALMQKGIDPKQRWRLNLAIKQELDVRKLLELSVDGEETIAQPATELLVRLAMMTSADETELRSTIEVGAREQKLNAVEQARSTIPASGKYAAMLYVDVERNPPSGSEAAEPSAGGVPERSNNIPLPSAVITIRQEGQVVHVEADGQELQLSNEPGQPASLRINVAPLLQTALESGAAEKESISGQIDLSVLNQERVCQLKYERLGTWSCEAMMEQAQPSTETEKPLRLIGAKLLLEPLPPK